MNKLLFLKKIAFPAASAIGVLLCFSWCPAETTGFVSVERLHQLGEKIDSIEVEKQAKKRTGLPLEELEAKTDVFRDSIKTLRQELGQAAPPVAAASPVRKKSIPNNLKQLLSGLKNQLYDRILIAAGILTIIIGLFFLFVALALKSRRKKQSAAQNQTNKAAAQYEDVRRKVAAAQNAYPDSFTNTTFESAALASAIPPSSQAVPTAAPATQPRLPAQSSEGDLKELVLKAGNEGLDAKEISRRFHISIDLVTLMLKMAKKQ